MSDANIFFLTRLPAQIFQQPIYSDMDFGYRTISTVSFGINMEENLGGWVGVRFSNLAMLANKI